MYKLCPNITMANGNIFVPDCIKRVSDEALIPKDQDNTDYQQYLKWVEEGNTPLPAENN